MVPSQVAKLEERIAKIDAQLDKLRKQEEVEGYEEKVRQTVGLPTTTGWSLCANQN